MDEGNLIYAGQRDHFDNAWNSHSENVGFHRGVQKYLGGDPRRVNQIQDEPM
jgi:hypothetical protein